jgi:hypothetical protein
MPRAATRHRTVLCSSESGGLSTERAPVDGRRVRFLVAPVPVRDLLIRAKNLFVAANGL